MSNDAAYRNDEAFQPRYMNVMKLQSVVDCDIAIAELKYAIDGIHADIAGGWGDADWLASAQHALKDYEHKARLVVIKRQGFIDACEAKRMNRQAVAGDAQKHE